MKSLSKVLAIVMVLGLMLGFAPTTAVRADTLDVCPSGCTYTSIQAAITAATAGDTIHVAAGTYNETVQITKQLTLVGTSAVIDGGGTGPVVMILASGTSFSGFTVRNSGTDPVGSASIGLIDVTGCTVQGNTTSNNFYGIAMQNADTNIIRENTITGSGVYGIYVGYNASGASTGNTIDDNTIILSSLDGIYLDIDSHNNIITNNDILNTVGGQNSDGYPEGNGIYLWKAATATITGNTISGNERYGIEMMGSANNTISGNTITGNLVGVEIRYSGYPEGAYPSSPNTVTKNKIYNNTEYNLFASPEVTSVTANNNWWGTANVPLITGKLSGAVTYQPYYIDEAMTTLSSVAPTTVYVDDSFLFPDCGTHSCGYDAFTTIQEGVAAVATGGTVNVAEGTYTPPAKITLNKAITISGPTTSEAKVIGIGGSGLTVFEITSSNVNINNLTLTLNNPPLAHIGIIHAPDGAKTNINITENTIYVNPQPGAMSTWWGQAVYLGKFTTASNVSDNLIYNMRGGVVVAYSSALTISDNVIYNTKGGIMNYTGTVADADARVITGNSWNNIHNEWDIVWNSGGGPYVMDMDKYVLQLSKANSDGYVVSQMTTGVLAELTGNRSHVFVDDMGTTTLKADNGNINGPYKKIQDGVNAVVPGGTVYVAAGTYDEENIQVSKGLFLLGEGAAATNIAPSVVTNNSTISVNNPTGNVLIDGFTFTMQPKINYGSAIAVTGTGIPVDSVTVTISNNIVIGSDDGSKSDYGFYGQGNNAKIIITKNEINKTGDNPIVMENQFGSTTVENNIFQITNSPDYNPYFSMAWNGSDITTPQIVSGNTFYLDHSGTGYAEAITFDTAIGNGWYGDPTDTGYYHNIQILNNTIYTNGPSARGIGFIDMSNGDGMGTISGAVVTGNQIIGENLTDIATYGITLRGDVEGAIIQNNTVSNIDLGIWIRPGLGASPVCPTGSDISLNKITSVAKALQNDCTAGSIDASPNWWGSASGPAVGTIIGTGVTYIPWCTNAACTTFGAPVVNVTQSTYFATIQAAIDDSVTTDGDVIVVAAGTYLEQVNINKQVSIIGSGREGVDATIIRSTAYPTVLLGATGTSTSPILLQDLQIQGAGGIRTTVTPIDYFTLDNVWLNANPVKSGEGIRVAIGHQLTHLTITDSIIEGYIDGVIIEKTPGTGDAGTKLQYVTVTDTIFRNNYRKGLYVETLSDATFTNVQLIGNGYVNPGTNLAEYNSAGFDINLKDGTYSNLQFINMTATGNGLMAKDGAALMIKARSDGTTYSVYPATLTGVTITGGTFTGNERGIRFGEPNKDNAGPTNVVITGASLFGNVKTYESTDGSAYGDVVNYALAPVSAMGNWWGSATGPAAGQTYGDVMSCGWLDAAPPTGVAVAAPVVNTTRGTSFCSIQAAIDDVATANGDVIEVAAGVYDAPTLINKSVTLLGANATVNPNTGTRGTETVILGITTPPALSQTIEIDAVNVVIKGYTFDNTRFDNYTNKIGTNTQRISGTIIENNIFANVYGTAIYLRDESDAVAYNSGPVSILNNKIDAPASAGSVEHNAGTGIILKGTDGSSISGNVILNAAYNGIQLSRNKDITINGNVVTGAQKPALQVAEWNDGTSTISGNTFSTLSTTRAAVRLYGFTNEFYPVFNFTGNTIKDSVYGVQIGREDTGLNDIMDADYSFSSNAFTNISSYRLIVYLTAAATAAEITEMDELFAQTYAPGTTAKAITAATPWTYVVAACSTDCYVSKTGSDTNIGTEALPFQTIQKGIDSVEPNGTVHVAAGTYIENVVVNNSVTIDGAGADTIVMPADSDPGLPTGSSLLGSNIFLVEANDVKITDLVIDGDNPDLDSGVVFGDADLDARNGIITNHANGVYNGLEVSYVTVKNIYLRGIYASSGGTFNIHHNTINNTQGSDQSFAIMVYNGTGFVADNVVDYGAAVGANYSQGTQWLRNTLTHTPGGIHTDNAGLPSILGPELISGNTVDCTGVSGGYGIWTFVNRMPITVENNTVTSCEVAYSAWGSGNSTVATFQNNTATAPAQNTDSAGIYVTTSGAGWGYFDVNADFSGNNLSGFETGVFLSADPATWETAPYVEKTITSNINRNNVTGSSAHAAYQGTDGIYTIDLEENWWGSILGPQAPISDNVDVIQWCGTANPVCLPLLPQSGTTLTINGAEELGEAKIYVPNLSIVLADGANIANTDGPCFSVNADHTTIVAATKLGAVCTPAAGFNGIDVAAGLTDITIANLEFAGTAGTDGIHFAGVVDNLFIYDNWFHDLAGDAIDFGSYQPTGDVKIQGNLFEENTGLGIRATVAIPAEYNSWGHIDGALAGDGASSSVVWTPWTHVDLYMASPTGLVAGQPITFTVYGNLENAMGAAITLKYPDSLIYSFATNLSTFQAAGSALFTTSTGAITFNGIAPVNSPISGVDIPLFSVTFFALTGDDGLLDLDETTDLFSMVPQPAGPSTNIYALKLVDSVVTTSTYAVKGTFYMQGHYENPLIPVDNRSGIPGTLTGLVNGVYKTLSVNSIPNNMFFTYIPAQSYIFTTLQPRYLNITADLGKEVTVVGEDVIFAESLWLLGGNAVWSDNIINISDASAVGLKYGIGTIDDNADVTFDGKVDILDLSLVAGNFDKTSASAYADWDPQP